MLEQSDASANHDDHEDEGGNGAPHDDHTHSCFEIDARRATTSKHTATSYFRNWHKADMLSARPNACLQG
jgi:hypothetical protein